MHIHTKTHSCIHTHITIPTNTHTHTRACTHARAHTHTPLSPLGSPHAKEAFKENGESIHTKTKAKSKKERANS